MLPASCVINDVNASSVVHGVYPVVGTCFGYACVEHKLTHRKFLQHHPSRDLRQFGVPMSSIFAGRFAPSFKVSNAVGVLAFFYITTHQRYPFLYAGGAITPDPLFVFALFFTAIISSLLSHQ